VSILRGEHSPDGGASSRDTKRRRKRKTSEDESD
jgi:hypothetical protein